MMYFWLKSLHLAAVLVFAGGLTLLAVVTSGWALAGGTLLPHEKQIGTAVLLWDRRVTVPSMAAVWALGLSLAVWGGWMGQGWLFGKIALVVALSGLHGVLAAMLRRRMESKLVPTPSWLRHSPVVIVVCLAAISVLIIVKP